jgi:hypothetical protein
MAPEQVEAILAHELAHIRRHDYVINLVQSVLEVVLFHHPAAHWVSRVIRDERENCCDDLAVASCGDRLVYVKALATLEDLRVRGWVLTQAATGGSSLARIRRILGKGETSMRSSLSISSLLIVLLSGAALAVAAPPKEGHDSDPGPIGCVSNPRQLREVSRLAGVFDDRIEAEFSAPHAAADDAPRKDDTAKQVVRSILDRVVSAEDAKVQSSRIALDKVTLEIMDRTMLPTTTFTPQQLEIDGGGFDLSKLLVPVQRNIETGNRADNVRVVVDRIAQKIDPAKHYPLVGICELVHEHYKCTIYFDEREGEKVMKRVEVVYTDRDRLRPVSAAKEPQQARAKDLDRKLGELIKELETLRRGLNK